MKALLENKFAPITFRWGFVESPFSQFSEALIQWGDQIAKKFSTRKERKEFRAPLSESLSALEPLTTPLDRYLLTETRTGWTAIFANGLRVTMSLARLAIFQPSWDVVDSRSLVFPTEVTVPIETDSKSMARLSSPCTAPTRLIGSTGFGVFP